MLNGFFFFKKNFFFFKNYSPFLWTFNLFFLIFKNINLFSVFFLEKYSLEFLFKNFFKFTLSNFSVNFGFLIFLLNVPLTFLLFF